jgi:hypothetical protein
MKQQQQQGCINNNNINSSREVDSMKNKKVSSNRGKQWRMKLQQVDTQKLVDNSWIHSTHNAHIMK